MSFDTEDVIPPVTFKECIVCIVYTFIWKEIIWNISRRIWASWYRHCLLFKSCIIDWITIGEQRCIINKRSLFPLFSRWVNSPLRKARKRVTNHSAWNHILETNGFYLKPFPSWTKQCMSHWFKTKHPVLVWEGAESNLIEMWDTLQWKQKQQIDYRRDLFKSRWQVI